MIYEDFDYGNLNIKTVLEFGFGDIRIVNAKGEDGHASVMFKNNGEPSLIGTSYPTQVMTSDDYAPDMIMIFTKKESIDIVIEYLQKAKESF